MMKIKKKDRYFLRSSKKTKIKRPISVKKFLKPMIVGLFFLSIIISFFYIPYFKIKKISIGGNKFINTQDIINIIKAYLNDKKLFVFPVENIFIFSSKEIEKKIIDDNPRIKNIKIKKKFPDEISLDIIERKQVALFCRKDDENINEECFFLDEDGYVYERAPNFSDNLYLKFYDKRSETKSVVVGEYFFSGDEIRKLIETKDLIEKEGIKIIKINIEDDGIYKLITSDNWFILIKNKNGTNSIINNLKIVLDKIGENKKKLEYINLLLENKIYYKFR